MMDYAHRQTSPATFQPIAFHPKDKPFLPPPDIHTPLAITITSAQVPKHKISKTNTHPLTSSSAFKVWDPNKSHVQHQVPLMAQPPLSQPNCRRQAFTNKRQFSIETLPELFTQPLGYGQSPHLHPKHKGLPTNSKTEVTVWGESLEKTQTQESMILIWHCNWMDMKASAHVLQLYLKYIPSLYIFWTRFIFTVLKYREPKGENAAWSWFRFSMGLESLMILLPPQNSGLVLLAFRCLLWPRPMCPIAKGRSPTPQEPSHPFRQCRCAVNFNQPRATTQWVTIQTILDHWGQRTARKHKEKDSELTKVSCEREGERKRVSTDVCYFSQWIRV